MKNEKTDKIEGLEELKTTYILTRNNQIHHVIDLGINEKGQREFVNVGDVFTMKPNSYSEHDSKKDALYTKMVKELTGGKSLNNFKRSKYYKYYVQRLKKEHPEFVI